MRYIGYFIHPHTKLDHPVYNTTGSIGYVTAGEAIRAAREVYWATFGMSPWIGLLGARREEE